MSHASFVHLRVRTCWSLLESTVRPDRLIAACQKERMPAVAMTDHAALFGAVDFGGKAASGGVQPIVGCLLPVLAATTERGEPITGEVVLLCRNEAGYGSLMQLLAKAYLEGEPREVWVDPDTLAAHHEGLILLTGGAEGALGRLLQAGRTDEAKAVLERLAAAFAGRTYVELIRTGSEAEARTEPWFVDRAYDLDLPLVATNDVRFLAEPDHRPHDALVCIAQGRRLVEEDRPRVSPEHRFKTAEEMAALFEDLPEAIANTLVVARRCAFKIDGRKPILPAFHGGEGRDEAAELRVQARDGLERRLDRHVRPNLRGDVEAELERYRERLAFELDVIVSMDFPGYFLIVSDFIRWAKGQGIPVGPGRGSGAGSVVAWALEITDLDPLRFGLLFERFLNPERVSMPDFDIDFCQDRRDEVIAYVADKYGHDRVAHIITFGRLQARAVVRDVGRVMGLPYGQVDRISKLIPHNPANPPTIEQALEMEPRLDQERRQDDQIADLIDVAQKLEGLPRHASTHAAGVVIGDRPLSELVPLYRDPRSPMPVTQFDMKAAEKVGLVKFDFLGLTTLTLLRTAEKLANEVLGASLVLDELPLDDPAAYAVMARADTNNVFQLESGGMKAALKELKPDCFEDIIAMVSLYRPGPMDNIPRYIAVKHGREDPAYLHPKLEPILKETNGVIIYQEQVMQIARDLAGYSLGGADLLRRAMGKKIKAEMDQQRAVFVTGAVERGIEEGLANTIFDQVAKFASYGFNKSHAAAYALLAYQTAYVKAHHPLAFFAAAMTMDRANHARLANAREEMVRQGIELLGPDVNRSGVMFAIEHVRRGDGTTAPGAVRFALAAIKGVGEQAMAALVAEREANGAFADLFDLCARLGPKVLNRRLLEGLIRAGALDSFGPNRAVHLEAIEAALRYGAAMADARAADQVGLFDSLGADVAIPKPKLPDVPPQPMLQVLDEEHQALGFFLSAHPLDGARKALDRIGVAAISNLLPLVHEGRQRLIKLAGISVAKQERNGARGRFAFITLSDPSGQVEITVYGDLLAQVRDLLEKTDPVVVHVEARADGDDLRLIAQDVVPLADAIDGAGSWVEVHVAEVPAIDRVLAMLQPQGQGAARVRLVVPGETGDERVVVQLPDTAVLPFALRADVAAIRGVREVRDLG
ncbi:MAG: DNA polymerase III subunit alpha [Pseudomonadota bacterium]